MIYSHKQTPKTKPMKRYLNENVYAPTRTMKHSPVSTPVSTPHEMDLKKKTRNDYFFLHQIGSGGFGRVWKVEDKRTSENYAMKEMSKAKYIYLNAGSSPRRALPLSSMRGRSSPSSITSSSST